MPPIAAPVAVPPAAVPSAAAPAAIAAARAAGGAPPDATATALRRLAQDFEAMVLGELMQPMFGGLRTSGPFSGGAGEAAFRPLLVQEFGRAAAAARGLGIADMLLGQLLRTQESAP